jgi:hypothetical protein
MAWSFILLSGADRTQACERGRGRWSLRSRPTGRMRSLWAYDQVVLHGYRNNPPHTTKADRKFLREVDMEIPQRRAQERASAVSRRGVGRSPSARDGVSRHGTPLSK